MTPARFRWGLLLITIGVMLLLNNTDQLDWEYWVDLLQWWPVILIAIGIEKIFLHSRLRFISYLAPLLLVGAMVYVAVDTGRDYDRPDFFSSYNWNEKLGDSVTKTVAVLDHYKSDLYVKAANDDEIAVRINRFTQKPRIEYSESGGIASLDIAGRVVRRGESWIPSRRHYSRNWNVSLAGDIPLDITCRGKESDVTLNLKQIPAEMIKIDNDDGDIDIRVGNLSKEVYIEIKGDEARLRMSIPEECGLKISGGDNIEYFQTMGLITKDDYYVTGDFDTAGIRVVVDINGDLRHLSISRK